MLHSHNKIYTLLLLCLLGVSRVSYGQHTTYHSDPNIPQSSVPDNTSKPAATGLVITNNTTQDFSVLVSTDNTKWNTVPIKANGGTLQYTEKIVYVKIYTTADKFKYYKLLSGFSYAIAWDSTNQLWTLQ